MATSGGFSRGHGDCGKGHVRLVPPGLPKPPPDLVTSFTVYIKSKGKQGRKEISLFLFKEQPCRNWEESQRCPWAQECLWAHGEAEVRERGYGPTPEEADERGYDMPPALRDWWSKTRHNYAHLLKGGVAHSAARPVARAVASSSGAYESHTFSAEDEYDNAPARRSQSTVSPTGSSGHMSQPLASTRAPPAPAVAPVAPPTLQQQANELSSALHGLLDPAVLAAIDSEMMFEYKQRVDSVNVHAREAVDQIVALEVQIGDLVTAVDIRVAGAEQQLAAAQAYKAQLEQEYVSLTPHLKQMNTLLRKLQKAHAAANAGPGPDPGPAGPPYVRPPLPPPPTAPLHAVTAPLPLPHVAAPAAPAVTVVPPNAAAAGPAPPPAATAPPPPPPPERVTPRGDADVAQPSASASAAARAAAYAELQRQEEQAMEALRLQLQAEAAWQTAEAAAAAEAAALAEAAAAAAAQEAARAAAAQERAAREMEAAARRAAQEAERAAADIRKQAGQWIKEFKPQHQHWVKLYSPLLTKPGSDDSFHRCATTFIAAPGFAPLQTAIAYLRRRIEVPSFELPPKHLRQQLSLAHPYLLDSTPGWEGAPLAMYTYIPALLWEVATQQKVAELDPLLTYIDANAGKGADTGLPGSGWFHMVGPDGCELPSVLLSTHKHKTLSWILSREPVVRVFKSQAKSWTPVEYSRNHMTGALRWARAQGANQDGLEVLLLSGLKDGSYGRGDADVAVLCVHLLKEGHAPTLVIKCLTESRWDSWRWSKYWDFEALYPVLPPPAAAAATPATATPAATPSPAPGSTQPARGAGSSTGSTGGKGKGRTSATAGATGGAKAAGSTGKAGKAGGGVTAGKGAAGVGAADSSKPPAHGRAGTATSAAKGAGSGEAAKSPARGVVAAAALTLANLARPKEPVAHNLLHVVLQHCHPDTVLQATRDVASLFKKDINSVPATQDSVESAGIQVVTHVTRNGRDPLTIAIERDPPLPSLLDVVQVLTRLGADGMPPHPPFDDPSYAQGRKLKFTAEAGQHGYPLLAAIRRAGQGHFELRTATQLVKALVAASHSLAVERDSPVEYEGMNALALAGRAKHHSAELVQALLTGMRASARSSSLSPSCPLPIMEGTRAIVYMYTYPLAVTLMAGNTAAAEHMMSTWIARLDPITCLSAGVLEEQQQAVLDFLTTHPAGKDKALRPLAKLPERDRIKMMSISLTTGYQYLRRLLLHPESPFQYTSTCVLVAMRCTALRVHEIQTLHERGAHLSATTLTSPPRSKTTPTTPSKPFAIAGTPDAKPVPAAAATAAAASSPSHASPSRRPRSAKPSPRKPSPGRHHPVLSSQAGDAAAADLAALMLDPPPSRSPAKQGGGKPGARGKPAGVTAGTGAAAGTKGSTTRPTQVVSSGGAGSTAAGAAGKTSGATSGGAGTKRTHPPPTTTTSTATKPGSTASETAGSAKGCAAGKVVKVLTHPGAGPEGELYIPQDQFDSFVENLMGAFMRSLGLPGFEGSAADGDGMFGPGVMSRGDGGGAGRPTPSPPPPTAPVVYGPPRPPPRPAGNTGGGAAGKGSTAAVAKPAAPAAKPSTPIAAPNLAASKSGGVASGKTAAANGKPGTAAGVVKVAQPSGERPSPAEPLSATVGGMGGASALPPPSALHPAFRTSLSDLPRVKTRIGPLGHAKAADKALLTLKVRRPERPPLGMPRHYGLQGWRIRHHVPEADDEEDSECTDDESDGSGDTSATDDVSSDGGPHRGRKGKGKGKANKPGWKRPPLPPLQDLLQAVLARCSPDPPRSAYQIDAWVNTWLIMQSGAVPKPGQPWLAPGATAQRAYMAAGYRRLLSVLLETYDQNGKMVYRTHLKSMRLRARYLFGQGAGAEEGVADLLDMLLASGAVDVNERDPERFNMTLLHLAAYDLAHEAIDVLLLHGADPHAVIPPHARHVSGTGGKAKANTLEERAHDQLDGCTAMHMAVKAVADRAQEWWDEVRHRDGRVPGSEQVCHCCGRVMRRTRMVEGQPHPRLNPPDRDSWLKLHPERLLTPSLQSMPLLARVPGILTMQRLLITCPDLGSKRSAGRCGTAVPPQGFITELTPCCNALRVAYASLCNQYLPLEDED